METTSSLQIFIYKLRGINYDNNFPILRFSSQSEMYSFISKLESSRQYDNTINPFFVINNPQLLPDEIRKKHMYPSIDNDDSSDDEKLEDGVFYFTDKNVELLRDCDIDNNTLLEHGFAEVNVYLTYRPLEKV